MYQEPDRNIGVIGMIHPVLEKEDLNAGKLGIVQYIDYLNDGVGLDIAPSTFYRTEAILVLKPRSIHIHELTKAESKAVDRDAIRCFNGLLDKETDESKKQALKFAYDNSTLRGMVVVDFRDYIEWEMERYEDHNRGRNR